MSATGPSSSPPLETGEPGINKEAKELEVLLSEKAVADAQIGSAMDLNVKVLGYFGAVFLLAGWLVGEKGPLADAVARGTPSPTISGIVLLIVVVGCAVVLQGICTYSVALGYIYYKDRTLGPRIGTLLSRSSPIRAVSTIRSGPSMLPLALGSGTLLLTHAALCAFLLAFAFEHCRAGLLRASWWAALLVLVATLGTEVALVRAMRKVGT